MSNRRLCIVLLSFALATGVAGGAGAQSQPPSPEALQAANELFSIISKDLLKQMVSQLTAQFWPPLEKDLRAKRPDISDATLADLRAEFERIQLRNLPRILADAPAIYARHFTAQELHELLAFYRTPTGQKALRELPQVMGEFTAGMLPKLKDMQQEAAESFKAVLRQRGLSL